MDVIKAFEGLLTTDVAVFVFVELVSACYKIGRVWAFWRLGIDVCKDYPLACTLDPYLLGANWCVSSIAIYNIIIIEERFHELEGMRKFGPRLKFYSIKVMVLVSFWSGLFKSP